MSMALRLLPVDHNAGTWGFSHSILEVGDAEDVREWLRYVQRFTLPQQRFNTFCGTGEDGEHRYGPTFTDPYGDMLVAVRALELVKFEKHDAVQLSFRRRAAWAYVRELPPETLVALYWH